MLSTVMLSIVILSTVMMNAFVLFVVLLGVITPTCRYFNHHNADCQYAECGYAECRYSECHYAECHYVDCRGAFLSTGALRLAWTDMACKTFFRCILMSRDGATTFSQGDKFPNAIISIRHIYIIIFIQPGQSVEKNSFRLPCAFV